MGRLDLQNFGNLHGPGTASYVRLIAARRAALCCAACSFGASAGGVQGCPVRPSMERRIRGLAPGGAASVCFALAPSRWTRSTQSWSRLMRPPFMPIFSCNWRRVAYDAQRQARRVSMKIRKPLIKATPPRRGRRSPC
jgi:hypothetical protein